MLRTIFASKITKTGFVTHRCAQSFAEFACYAQDFFPVQYGAQQQRCATLIYSFFFSSVFLNYVCIGLTGITCELHQLVGTLASTQLTPLLEAASVFSRSSPLPTGPQQIDGETRLGSSLPESFRPSSFEKDPKVGSFEKSLSPNDLRAIHEMLNSQRNSRSSPSLSKLEAEEREKAEKDKAEKEKEKVVSEEDYSREDLSDDDDDDVFFECNDDIPSTIDILFFP